MLLADLVALRRSRPVLRGNVANSHENAHEHASNRSQTSQVKNRTSKSAVWLQYSPAPKTSKLSVPGTRLCSVAMPALPIWHGFSPRDHVRQPLSWNRNQAVKHVSAMKFGQRSDVDDCLWKYRVEGIVVAGALRRVAASRCGDRDVQGGGLPGVVKELVNVARRLNPRHVRQEEADTLVERVKMPRPFVAEARLWQDQVRIMKMR